MFQFIPYRDKQCVLLLAYTVLLTGCFTVRPPMTAPKQPAKSAQPVQPVQPVQSPTAIKPALREVTWQGLPGWQDNKFDQSLRALRRSCQAGKGRQQLGQNICQQAKRLGTQTTPTAIRQFFEQNFTPFKLGVKTGLITGYYAPVISGRLRPDHHYKYPVLGVPDDLLVVNLAEFGKNFGTKKLRARRQGRTLKPYWSRQEIEQNIDRFKKFALAWVADPVALFFMHIQGSGMIKLADRSLLKLGYAEQNGHPYTSIGKVLIKRQALAAEAVTAPAIKRWLQRNSQARTKVLNKNQSYIFFRKLPDQNQANPLGSLGVPLSPGYSLAVDRKWLPLGLPVYLSTIDPEDHTPIQRLMLAQDTGGAIKGIPRGDFYFGYGDAAGRKAGLMKARGTMWVLLPKQCPQACQRLRTKYAVQPINR